jgi:poly-gamma-glutamate synthesis protein (capsule biosynthesis protein)
MRIAFLGDTLLGGQAQRILERRGYAYAFDGLAPVLAGADLVVANLEGPLTSRDRPAAKDTDGRRRWWYRALPESVSALAEAGIGLVSLANNHVLDFGAEGLAETLATLDAAGIAHCGAGPDLRAASAPATVTVGGLRVGFCAAMQRYRMYEAESLYATAERPGPCRLRPAHLPTPGDVDLWVALVHWGRTYRPVTDRQRRLAAALVGAGADLVVGTHPHVVQPLELVAGRPVLYSIGNGPFRTRGRFAQRGRLPHGLVVTVEWDDDARISALDLQVIDVDNLRLRYRPVPVGAPRRVRTRRRRADSGT